ncbi:response regulator [bacterium]|nr:response regulator [bacterium]
MTKILIVEDETIIAFGVMISLEEMGFTVIGIARTGPQALELIEQQRPDLVLLDVNLAQERLDGIHTASILRLVYHLPYIFMTGSADEQTQLRIAQTKPLACLHKPFNPSEFIQVIQAHFQHNHNQIQNHA